MVCFCFQEKTQIVYKHLSKNIPINDRLPYHRFFILFLLLQEKNQQKQAQGALYVLLPQSNPPPCVSPGRIAGGLEHLNLNSVQAENVPIFCLKFGASEDGWAEIGTFPPCC
jgi:hypothetical protein